MKRARFEALLLVSVLGGCAAVGCYMLSDAAIPRGCPEGTEQGAGAGCYPVGRPWYPHDSGAPCDAAPGHWHRTCRVILPQGDANVYGEVCGPCQYPDAPPVDAGEDAGG
jgi:hypothetical protein